VIIGDRDSFPNGICVNSHRFSIQTYINIYHAFILFNLFDSFLKLSDCFGDALKRDFILTSFLNLMAINFFKSGFPLSSLSGAYNDKCRYTSACFRMLVFCETGKGKLG